MWLKSRLCVFISIHGHRHAHLFLSVLFFLVSLYFVLKSFFLLFLNPAMVPDENSMEDPLCNSSFGSMVSLDYVTPDSGSGKPETVNHQEEANSENFVMGSDATEFVNKVRDQVRNRQKRMSSIAESCDEHSIIWGMFMATTLNAATFMGKNFSTIQSVVKNHESLTLKQMFDVPAQLVNNQEEINGLDKILWGKFLDTSVID